MSNNESDSQYKQKVADYKATFSTPPGRRVLEEIKAVIFTPSFVKGDPHGTTYNEGARAFALEIYNLVNAPVIDQVKADSEVPEETNP